MKTLTAMSALVFASLVSAALDGCAATSHPTIPATLGTPAATSSFEVLVDLAGPIEVETVVSARWQVDRSGLVDLTSATAKAAGLVDGPEPIDLFIHVVHHPQGTYLVDTGVERAFLADPAHALVHGWMGSMAHLDKLLVDRDMASVVQTTGPVQGVFLTHLHLDHFLGTRDVPASVPVYVGAGDARDRSVMNLFEGGVYDQALWGKGALREVHFQPDPDGRFDGLLDVFGDGSFWAISVPGHTPGSMAFVARTPRGAVLLTGDACHTAWGWEHGVGPGTFSDDVSRSAESLARLRALVARHPSSPTTRERRRPVGLRRRRLPEGLTIAASAVRA
jgi:glyoxylase-like metal-dependent hydrolase (beta-lactamase superfamily II)